MIEVFLQEASEHLQFLREYSGLLQDPYPVPEDVERLYISAHTLTGTSASYGFPLFSEVADKLSHVFQYAMHASVGEEAAAPLVEFISEAVAVLESNLILISTNGVENTDDINAFKVKYPFAFTMTPQPEYHHPAAPESQEQIAHEAPKAIADQIYSEVASPVTHAGALGIGPTKDIVIPDLE